MEDPEERSAQIDKHDVARGRRFIVVFVHDLALADHERGGETWSDGEGARQGGDGREWRGEQKQEERQGARSKGRKELAWGGEGWRGRRKREATMRVQAGVL